MAAAKAKNMKLQVKHGMIRIFVLFCTFVDSCVPDDKSFRIFSDNQGFENIVQIVLK